MLNELSPFVSSYLVFNQLSTPKAAANENATTQTTNKDKTNIQLIIKNLQKIEGSTFNIVKASEKERWRG